jgi:E3 ubiquitin-protein ligase UBR1
MTATPSALDSALRRALCDHPQQHGYRFTHKAKTGLLDGLFRSLTNDRPEYLQELFPNGFPSSYKLQDAQGVQENWEYTAAAKGHSCGHIFKPGEASYHCSTCTDDTTAVLCSRCFVSSDHEGHQYTIGISAGNSGCCDCGDDEAWKRPVKCAIHTANHGSESTDEHISPLPTDLQEAIRTTISRVLDYFCDVISCSPENLRMPSRAGFHQNTTNQEMKPRPTQSTA